MEVINTNNAPIPAGHYSQAVVCNNFVFISGQLPKSVNSNEDIVDSIEDQTMQVLRNIEEILLAANSKITKVVKVTIYISDISLWGRVNKVYAEFFGDFKPARTVVPTKELHYGYQIEMDVIAAMCDK